MECKILKVLTVALAACACPGMEALELTLTAGELQGALGADALPEELEIKGEIDIRDFDFMRDRLGGVLKRLDLSQARIVAAEGVNTLTGRTESGADILPEGALMISSLTSVVLPGGLVEIADGALATTSVEAIDVPSTVKTIGRSAFAGCARLKSIEVPAGVERLGEGAFADCTALENASVIAGITALPARVFERCTSLVSVGLPASVATIGDNAFAGCTSLESVAFPASLESIGRCAFYGSGLTSAELAGCSRLSEIGEWSFAQCGNLTSVTFPEALHGLGSGAFYNAKSMTLEALPPVDALGDFSLANAGGASVGELTLKEGLEIGNYALSGWKGVQILTLPKHLGTIGDEAMAGWTDLRTIEATDVWEVPALGQEVWKGVNQPEVLLRVSNELADEFNSAEQWKEFNIESVDTGVDDVPAQGGDGAIKAWFEGMTLHVESPRPIAAMRIYDSNGREFSFPANGGGDGCIVAVDTSAWDVKVLLVRVELVSGDASTLKLLR